MTSIGNLLKIVYQFVIEPSGRKYVCARLLLGWVISPTNFNCFISNSTPSPGRSFAIQLAILEIEAHRKMRERSALIVILHQHRSGKRSEAFTSAAVAIGPVKCGTMPTKCVSQIAAIFIISVMPPTFGRVART